MKYQNYQFRCRTCKQQLQNIQIATDHINNNPEHKVMIREKTKYALLDIALNSMIWFSILGSVLYFFILPKLDEIIALCQQAGRATFA